MPQTPRPEVVVIGAGVVGLATALRLQLDGRRVVVIDRAAPGSGCSSGNAGYLSEGYIWPACTWDMLWRLPGMILNPAGPLVIRPDCLLRLAPWGLELLRSVGPSAVARTMAGLAALNRHAIDSYDALLDAADARQLVVRRGGLTVLAGAEAHRQAGERLSLFHSHGVTAELLDAAALADLEPGLRPGLAGAILFPGSAHCLDPLALSQAFARRIVEGGGEIIRDDVTALRPDGAGGWSIRCARSEVHADRVVVAAGRWSDRLMQPLGHRTPLESERGYHLMLPRPYLTLNHPLVIPERHFAITPMSGGIRIAGTVEFARPGAPMNPRRAEILFDQAAPYLPGLRRNEATSWMGERPTLPDSLPAIGASRRHPNLFYAFGHHHCGLTQAAVSARLVSDLVAGRPPLTDIHPFDLARFDAGSRPRDPST